MKINKAIKDNIIKVLSSYSGIEKIVLFGSRAQNQSQEISDIDLAIFGKNLSASDISIIRDDLEQNIKTPLKFDIIHFDALTKEFLKNNILKEGIVLYEHKKD